MSFSIRETEENIKHQHFINWDNKVKPVEHDTFPYSELLKGLIDRNRDLYNLAYALTVIYTDAHVLQENQANICAFLNEWLNNKKRINTNNETDFEKMELWEYYVEGLWNKLEQEEQRNYWCRRSFSQSIVAKAFSVSFTVFYSTIRGRFRSSIKNIIRLEQNFHKDTSNGLLGSPSKYSGLNIGNNRISISYHCARNS
ncbi:PIR Superfamily Protein [Plasmodium ovale curtisi]|uniref:PIR Superfamily Protein n=1 Tax=Plasmodium ovale curtisi TaxID=864141 RepID=A0A1A8WSP5_PLAOA|nr:PIR Superfamily Protein [Plasmodium ovale curtisi]SBT01354.1 PIR Superfamily Protein [Plasmodium ovale curtisi]